MERKRRMDIYVKMSENMAVERDIDRSEYIH